MATPLAPWKIQITYLNSPTPQILLYMRKIPQFLAQNWNQCNFGLFLPKFGCYCNSLGSLEILYNIFEFADPRNLSIDAKIVSISCTEMKLCLFKCLTYLHHCGYRQFSRFLRKIAEIVNNFLIKPQIGTRIHGNTSYDERCDLGRRARSKNFKKKKR